VDRVARLFGQQVWTYAEQDFDAFAEIGRRVAEVGKRRDLLTYSELVSGIDFRLPTVLGGKPQRLGVPDWGDLHRAIIGDFLGRLCMDTYMRGGFMGGALVVASETRQPSDGYRNLMRIVGVLPGRGDSEFIEHWVKETSKAYDWYAAHA
jgi:hypothetical protein